MRLSSHATNPSGKNVMEMARKFAGRFMRLIVNPNMTTGIKPFPYLIIKYDFLVIKEEPHVARSQGRFVGQVASMRRMRRNVTINTT